jgi:hypothetical protein
MTGAISIVVLAKIDSVVNIPLPLLVDKAIVKKGRIMA